MTPLRRKMGEEVSEARYLPVVWVSRRPPLGQEELSVSPLVRAPPSKPSVFEGVRAAPLALACTWGG